jgi:hypothetical protein
MDTNVLLLVVTVLFVGVIVFAINRYRRRLKAKVVGPAGAVMTLDGSNEDQASPPGVRAKGLISRTGAIRAHDETGRGVDVTDADASQDIVLRVGKGHTEADAGYSGKLDPKA